LDKTLEVLFEATVALENDAQRADYLNEACPDPELRREVESLVAAHQNPDRVFAKEPSKVSPAELGAPRAGGGGLIGGYRIIRALGQGGMGAVYEAEEVASGRRLAIKVLSQALDSPVARKRFFREGLLAASVNHPNTVYVFGTEEIDGRPVIAMELVRGGTLQERVARGNPMPVAEAVDAILQVVAGLEAAAARGILTQHDDHVITSLPEISVPTLVLVGADDDLFRAPADYMAATIPGAELGVIARAGHAPHIDNAPVFHELVRNFLATADG